MSFEQRGDGTIDLRFANGATAEADALVAADGVHSLVKDVLFGREEPNFAGRVAYRTVFPAALLNGYPIDDCTKWWGPACLIDQGSTTAEPNMVPHDRRLALCLRHGGGGSVIQKVLKRQNFAACNGNSVPGARS